MHTKYHFALSAKTLFTLSFYAFSLIISGNSLIFKGQIKIKTSVRFALNTFQTYIHSKHTFPTKTSYTRCFQKEGWLFKWTRELCAFHFRSFCVGTHFRIRTYSWHYRLFCIFDFRLTYKEKVDASWCVLVCDCLLSKKVNQEICSKLEVLQPIQSVDCGIWRWWCFLVQIKSRQSAYDFGLERFLVL